MSRGGRRHISDALRRVLSSFSFEETNDHEVYKLLHDIDVKKATGYDGILPKMLQISARELCKPSTDIINLSIKSLRFPKQLKLAEVSPLFKKSFNLERGNLVITDQ